MTLASYQRLIPFDEVVVAMNKVAHQIARELKYKNLVGLSIIPTADKRPTLRLNPVSAELPALSRE
jgi:hypothetical protein